MTDLQEKAMRMALERLESHEYWMDEDAIQALRQAIAQPQPVQFKCTVVDDGHPNGVPLSQWGRQPEQEPIECMCGICKLGKREWVGLTADELNMIGVRMQTWNNYTLTDVYYGIEAKLKEKNT